jgi:ubiquinone/menaquinone biosynthesis C-methylase UbiE
MIALVEDTAAEAFSRQASDFDAIDAANPLIGWVRDRVRAQAIATMHPGDHVLELNAGTGIDSFYFAQQGMHVLATDAAPGMIAQLRQKARSTNTAQVSVMECSFLELERVGDRRFHHVFSNFGGLNCTNRLDIVLRGIDRVLLPDGTCTLVIMPRFSPWETGALFKGNLSLALRRWRKNGTPAHVEDVVFPCHYYSPAFVKRHFGKGYTTLSQRALSLLVPPPHHAMFPAQWPRLFRSLSSLEDHIAHWPLFRNWGDHFVITLRKRP